MFSSDVNDLIRVRIQQFYGIEINDFAVAVSKTALWIAEYQMYLETLDLYTTGYNNDFLPLDSYNNIIEGNALRINWNEVIPYSKCNYIIGNPPFQGKKSQEQLSDMKYVFNDTDAKYGILDYVSCWFKKAASYIKDTEIKCALIATNSITQGVQVPILWRCLNKYNININFAYESFQWKSESKDQAQVYVVIIGFSGIKTSDNMLFLNDANKYIKVKHINGYLLDGEDIYVDNINQPIDNRQKMYNGIDYTDNLIYKLSEDEAQKLAINEPLSKKYIRPYSNGKELLNNGKSFCLWFQDVDLFDVRKCPTIVKKIDKVREYRKTCKKDTQKYADKPLQPSRLRFYSEGIYPRLLAFSGTFSQKYKWIPMKYVESGTIVTHNVIIIPEASLFTFGLLESNVHMIWTKMFSGKLGDGISYSNGTVYNTFPFPKVDDNMKLKIEKAAKSILDIRKKYSDKSLSELYDERFMPLDLKQAHELNDKVVWEAYGKKWNIKSESECIAELIKMYQDIINNQ